MTAFVMKSLAHPEVSLWDISLWDIQMWDIPLWVFNVTLTSQASIMYSILQRSQKIDDLKHVPHYHIVHQDELLSRLTKH